MVVCVGPPDKIKQGSSIVKVNGKPLGYMTAGTAHGGKIIIGSPNVLVKP